MPKNNGGDYSPLLPSLADRREIARLMYDVVGRDFIPRLSVTEGAVRRPPAGRDGRACEYVQMPNLCLAIDQQGRRIGA